MKITREVDNFRPITITLESYEEAESVRTVFNAYRHTHYGLGSKATMDLVDKINGELHRWLM